MQLDARHTLILAILVLFAGRWLNSRFTPLREWSIPEPVTGGLVASLLLTLAALSGFDVRFDLGARDTLLIAFFTTVGLSANLSLLAAGGAMLAILTAAAVTNLIIQNLIGVSLATAIGWSPVAGLLVGSAALSGGHGTVLAWAPTIAEQANLPSAAAIGAAAATFGLVAGGVLGGPLGQRLLERNRLTSEGAERLSVGVPYAEESLPRLDAQGVLTTLLAIALAMAMSDYVNAWLKAAGITLPAFVTALFCGMLLSNTVPRLAPKMPWPAGSAPLALVSELALGLFLAMSLMTLNLAQLADAALPMLGILAVQAVACWWLLTTIVFPVLGRSYDAAIATAGFLGLALGATPTAIAIMTALTKKHGASPRAFLVVPLVGAFFVDIANAAVLQSFLAFLSRG